MKYQQKELKKGVKLHTIQTNKFKTNLIAVLLTTKLTRENVTKNAVISAVLRRGSQTMPSQEEISKQMEEMYGASFDCGLDKRGDNQVLKFYVETIQDDFLPQKGENLLKISLEKILDIVLNPYTETDEMGNKKFKTEYVEQEKNNIRQRIEGKIDNKSRYALERCIEEMYPNEPYGLYRFGYKEDLEQINAKNLYNYYLSLIDSCKIDIFISGEKENIEEIVKTNANIEKLKERTPDFIVPKELNKELPEKENVVTESMEVTQGKLTVGLNVSLEKEDMSYDALLYNSILGGSANSKMFQNVREKAHLAYIASSSYLKYKNNIFVNCGIEIGNYEKALELVKKQIEDMKQGDFTEEDIENAKKGIMATIKTIEDEQDTQIIYYFGQELSQSQISVEDYKNRIEKIKKEDIVHVAENVAIHTIYFLKD